MKYEDKKKLIKAIFEDLTDTQKADMYQSMEESFSYTWDGYPPLNNAEEVTEMIEKMSYHSKELDFAIYTLLAHYGKHQYMQEELSDIFNQEDK